MCGDYASPIKKPALEGAGFWNGYYARQAGFGAFNFLVINHCCAIDKVVLTT